MEAMALNHIWCFKSIPDTTQLTSAKRQLSSFNIWNRICNIILLIISLIDKYFAYNVATSTHAMDGDL